jgi:hypothetical protein
MKNLPTKKEEELYELGGSAPKPRGFIALRPE